MASYSFYAEYHYAACHHADCHYAERRGTELKFSKKMYERAAYILHHDTEKNYVGEIDP
jgi:hypothetical protein